MGLPTLVVLSALTLITVLVASDVDDLTSHSAPSFSHFQAAPNTIVIGNDDPTPKNAQNDSADNLAPLSRHAFAKTGATTAKTSGKGGKRPIQAARRKKSPTAKARSPGGVTASATSSGTLVIASSSNGKRCVTIKRPCGTTCSSHSKSIGMCSGGSKPKYCFKTKKLLVACPGKKVKMCKTTEKVPGVCEKKVQKKERCPDTVGKRTVCAYPKVAVHSCKKLPSQCARMSKKKCRYQTTSKKTPCHKPNRPCRECLNNTAFKQCKATIARRVEVPCNGSATSGAASSTTPRPSVTPPGANTRSGASSTYRTPPPSPSSTPSVSPSHEVDFLSEHGGYDPSGEDSTDGFNNFDNEPAIEEEGGDFDGSSAIPITFGNAQEHTRSVRCFASLFNEDDCNDAPQFCQLFDEAFDSDKCTGEVCRECGAIKNMRVGRELKAYCRDLSASCHFFSRMLVTRMMETAAVARSAVEMSGEGKKCYRNENKTVVVPCNYRLPKSEVCKLGCRVGICEKIEKKRVTKYCRDHLPNKCYQKCKRKMVKRKVCHTLLERKRSEKMCKKDTKVKYKCYKNKTVKKPCKGQDSKLCARLRKVQYVCGKVVSKFGKCTGAKGEKKCRTKMCAQKRCY